jgi:cob(I)alamin adenosyltransferase
MEKGNIHIYTGNGKGKTTSAIGLVIRALGRNKKVLIIQFLKNAKDYGEHLFFKKYYPKLKIKRFGRKCIFPKKDAYLSGTQVSCEECYKKFNYLPCHFSKDKPKKIDVAETNKAWSEAKNAISSEKYDLIVLDEILYAMSFSLIKEKDVIKFLKNIHNKTDIVLTGRYKGKKLIEIADYVSNIKEVKHPFKKGIKAKLGIEY